MVEAEDYTMFVSVSSMPALPIVVVPARPSVDVDVYLNSATRLREIAAVADIGWAPANVRQRADAIIQDSSHRRMRQGAKLKSIKVTNVTVIAS
jgi:hypothetical protein